MNSLAPDPNPVTDESLILILNLTLTLISIQHLEKNPLSASVSP